MANTTNGVRTATGQEQRNGGLPELATQPSLPSVSGSTSSQGSKNINILLINPNATSSMTAACLKMLTHTLPPDVTVTGFTPPAPAPTAVEGAYDNIMSAAFAMRALIPLLQKPDHNYDAFLVACYSDHALIKVLREELTQPVIGIMEASLFAARTLGAKFGIVATSKRSAIGHLDNVRSYGMQSYCAGVRACELGVLDLERKPREEVLGTMKRVARGLVEEDGAEVLTLGCAGMSDMKLAVEQAVEELYGSGGVQVVDGVVAGVHHLVGLVRMGGKTAKRGLYESSAEGRKRRGQAYY